MNRAIELVEQLMSNPDSSEFDGLAYELLTEYQRGSPVDSLRILFVSPDDRLVGEGTWIASELPAEGKPLLRDIGILLGHRSKKVRFWAVDCVLLWADSSNGHELASATALVDDAEKAVRWKAMGFLSMATREQLRAALDQVATKSPDSPYTDELKWLLDHEEHPGEIVAGLRDDHTRRRRVAAAAAARLAKTDISPLINAISIEDPEIAEFAADALKRIRDS